MTGLEIGTHYVVRVRISNNHGPGPDSLPVNARTFAEGGKIYAVKFFLDFMTLVL